MALKRRMMMMMVVVVVVVGNVCFCWGAEVAGQTSEPVIPVPEVRFRLAIYTIYFQQLRGRED
jgi:hypothetical protein